MQKPIQFIAMIAFGLIATGCAKPLPPPSETLSQGMADALTDTGFYAQVSVDRVIGQHYVPADDRWSIYACYEFTLIDNTQGADCIDSISASKLLNGTWIIAVTINDVYRWRAISMKPGSTPTPDPATGSDP